MSVQVTLTLSDDVYKQAAAFAQSTNQDVAEMLAESIVLDWPPLPDDEEHRAMAREEAAYRIMYAEFSAKYPGQYVAIYQGKLIDRDPDLEAICDRIDEKYSNAVVLIRAVQPSPDEVLNFRSPRLIYG